MSESPLRNVRKKHGLSMKYVAAYLTSVGVRYSEVAVSNLETKAVWPRRRKVVDALVELFGGDITEMEILYPDRYIGA